MPRMWRWGSSASSNPVSAGIDPWDAQLHTGGWDVGLTPPTALGVEGMGRVAQPNLARPWRQNSAIRTARTIVMSRLRSG